MSISGSTLTAKLLLTRPFSGTNPNPNGTLSNLTSLLFGQIAYDKNGLYIGKGNNTYDTFSSDSRLGFSYNNGYRIYSIDTLGVNSVAPNSNGSGNIGAENYRYGVGYINTLHSETLHSVELNGKLITDVFKAESQSNGQITACIGNGVPTSANTDHPITIGFMNFDINHIGTDQDLIGMYKYTRYNDNEDYDATYPFIIRGNGDTIINNLAVTKELSADVAGGHSKIPKAFMEDAYITNAHITNLDATISFPISVSLYTISSYYQQGLNPQICMGGESGSYLGLSGRAFSSAYITSINGSAYSSGSDRALKKSIYNLNDSYDGVFDALIPKRFKYKEDTQMGSAYKDQFLGFIANDVKKALDDNNITSQTIVNGEEGSYALSYMQFIPLNTWQIQKLKKRVSDLEERLAKLENKE